MASGRVWWESKANVGIIEEGKRRRELKGVKRCEV